MDTKDLLESAYARLQGGAVQEALGLLREALEIQPENIDALHLLGLALALSGQAAAGVGFLLQAMRLDRHNPIIRANLARAQYAAGQYPEALENYELLLAHQPQADTWVDHGNVLERLQHPREALTSYRQALAIERTHANAWMSLGNVQMALGRLKQALSCHKRALELLPDSSLAWSNLGSTLTRMQQLEQALICCRQAIACDPGNAPAWSNWGLILHQCKQEHEALACIDRALVLAPAHPEALINRGTVLLELKSYQQGYESFALALAQNPAADIQAKAGYGCALASYRMKNIERALEHMQTSLALDPLRIDFWILQALLCYEDQRGDEALACIERALQLEPRNPHVLLCRGYLLGRTHRRQQELACYRQILQHTPGFPLAILNQAVAYLSMGDYERGWTAYEARWNSDSDQPLRHAQLPLWTGARHCPPAGKRILLWHEQGLGDMVLMARYVPLLQSLGAEVVVETYAPCIDLLCASLSCAIIERGASVGNCDYQIPSMSLPLAFQTRVETIPAPVSYLRADQARIEFWARRLARPGQQLRIGLACSGNALHREDRFRSMPIEHLEQHLTQLRQYATLFLLQKDTRGNEDQFLARHPEIIHLGREVGDLHDTAAIVANMDLVISVDTALAHLAGALGKPTWVLLHTVADWRWLSEREDSPWYPTARLFRQQRDGDWDGVMRRVMTALAQEFPS